MNPWTHTGPDATGTVDYDEPYRFGRRPSASAPYPFSTREYARLLMLRGRVRDRASELDRTGVAEQAA